MDIEQINEEEQRRRRRERIARMKREKERRLRMQRIFVVAMPVAVVLVAICVVAAVAHIRKNAGRENGKTTVADMSAAPDKAAAGQAAGKPDSGSLLDSQIKIALAVSERINSYCEEMAEEEEPDDPQEPQEPEKPAEPPYKAHTTERTAEPPEEVNSTNVVFIDLATGEILAQRDYNVAVNPASMTKVLTALVAAEHVTDLNDTFTITVDITDYSYFHDCSSVGFEVGEKVPIRDLFYGTILPSGADAALALAIYVAGSQEAFVDMMNRKAEELGISDTAHFTNCIGLYDSEHHCSVYDMCMIMEAALDNELCREVLAAHTYTTSSTAEHPEGILISNWFLRKIEDHVTEGEVICAKTGFVTQSRNCAVSYGVDAAGNGYVCATTGAHSSWRCIYDHVALYKAYRKQADSAEQ